MGMPEAPILVNTKRCTFVFLDLPSVAGLSLVNGGSSAYFAGIRYRNDLPFMFGNTKTGNVGQLHFEFLESLLMFFCPRPWNIFSGKIRQNC